MNAEKTAKKRNVTIVEGTHRFIVKCNQCGYEWSPNIRAGGRLPRRWWKCPNGCNVTQGVK
jgi:hypothetical protein